MSLEIPLLSVGLRLRIRSGPNIETASFATVVDNKPIKQTNLMVARTIQRQKLDQQRSAL